MDKLRIQQMLRESLTAKIAEAEQTDDESKSNKTYDELDKDERKKVQTLTKKIQGATQGSGKLLKLSQVMDVAGVGNADDPTDRSAIGKAVSGKPDADGKVRHLTIKQANAMGNVVDNPIAFK
jgi:hypothetical protein